VIDCLVLGVPAYLHESSASAHSDKRPLVCTQDVNHWSPAVPGTCSQHTYFISRGPRWIPNILGIAEGSSFLCNAPRFGHNEGVHTRNLLCAPDRSLVCTQEISCVSVQLLHRCTSWDVSFIRESTGSQKLVHRYQALCGCNTWAFHDTRHPATVWAEP
jgi:hypothetical protein